MTTHQYLVFGRVQRVGFRYHATCMAEAFDIRGWIRNRPDGCVEIVATGTRENLLSFREQIELGPTGARVDRVETIELDPQRFNGFVVRS